VSPVEYVGCKRYLGAHSAVCLQIHCNTSSYVNGNTLVFLDKYHLDNAKQARSKMLTNSRRLFTQREYFREKIAERRQTYCS